MKKTGSRGRGFVMCSLLGWTISLILTGLLAAIAALLVEKGGLPEKGMTVYAMAATGISAAAGCLTAALRTDHGALPASMLSGTLYFLTLCIGNGVLANGAFARFLPTALMTVGVGLLAGLIGAKKKPAYR